MKKIFKLATKKLGNGYYFHEKKGIWNGGLLKSGFILKRER